MRSGGLPAGSSRALRLDPFALPARYAASDAAADQQVRQVELHRERVIVRRAVRGMRMALNLPISAYRGVAIRMLASEDGAPPAVAVVLEHHDPALALPLFVSPDGHDVAAEWRAWAQVLGVPLLVADDAGDVYEPFTRIGRLRIAAPTPRRRRRSALKRRRPSILLRRQPSRLSGTSSVYRGEREIVARN